MSIWLMTINITKNTTHVNINHYISGNYLNKGLVMNEKTANDARESFRIGLPSDISARIKQCADLLGGVSALAKKSGMSRSSLDHYLRGPADFKLSKLKDIARAADQPINWLLDGDNMWREPGHDKMPSNAQIPDYILVPKMNIEVSAGHGAANAPEQNGDSLAFRKDWLKSKGLKAENLALVTVRGDSMEPTLPHQSILLVDTFDTRPSDGIYILLLEDQLFAKRVQVEFDGSLNIISDNPVYDRVTLAKNSHFNASIKGRVVWVGMDL